MVFFTKKNNNLKKILKFQMIILFFVFDKHILIDEICLLWEEREREREGQ